MSSSPEAANAMRRWVENMQAAEQRDRLDRRATPLTAAESWRRALALMAFAKQLGAPPPDDDEERVQRTWMRLREVMGRVPDLAEALEDPERARAFAALVAKSRG